MDICIEVLSNIMSKFINRKSLKILEYDKILSSVANYTSSNLAKDIVLSIRPSIEIEQAEYLLDLTEEAYKITYEHCVSPSFSLDDMSDILKNAQKHATLSCSDILKVGRLLRTSRLLYSAIHQINDSSIVNIKPLISGIYIDNELENSIYESILGENEVSDNASSALKSIRQSIRNCNDRIRQKLNSYVTSSEYSNYLQDSLITMRNNRYVIPLKSEYSRQIKGLVHDQSSSGATVYVEPMAIVELNNELRALNAEENNEIERILQFFSQKIAYVCENLTSSYKTVAFVDTIFAKARYAQEIRGKRVKLNNNGCVNVIDGRHPLIEKEKVVPVSIKIGEEYNTLLITGPNTGGKTVCLKLVGILSMMIASGIFAPCDGDSQLAIFDNIFCDIGDEQDIEQNLSTFSSHITNLIYISNHVSENCLLLLDELGGGTDPVEGSALAISLLEFFKSKGCKTVTSTHYNELKEYAYAQSGVAVAGMDFDPRTYAPTYRLIMGHSASSNALEIASALGLNKTIVDGARARMSKEKLAFDSVIKGAERSRREALDYEKKARENFEIAEKSTQEAKKVLDELNEQKQKLEEKMKKSAKDLLSDYLEEAEELLDELKEQVKKGDEQALFEARKLKKRLTEIHIDEQKPVNKFEFVNTAINVGDNVFVNSLQQVGEVLKINEKKKEFQIKIGILITNVKFENCKKINLHVEKEPVKVTVSKEFTNKPFSFELNLIGQRVDEALYNLDNYISDAILHNCTEIRIVHGKGTGILRKAVQDFLKESKHVESFRIGKYGEGESGVTIATLK